jgi:hypothetical protein
MSREEDGRRGADDRSPEPLGAGRGGAEDAERRARLAARRHFRKAPPYRIRFEENGRVSLSRKHYSYWGDPDPAAATRWTVLSLHADWEEAERRLRHITSPVAYYDAQGRLAAAPRAPDDGWGVPDDGEDGGGVEGGGRPREG